eukprot:TRINITY_DN4211_c0_g1_i5.p4 TRINITY_DN4211_c0_g1~~TRINITY_DN4211_c0_g1_i5.p4  ORF type:complete len:123 (-),score=24.50 TRINITY_DN4211_c0_g1_i5:153-521(-)
MYGVQLALNAAWNPLLFVGQKLDVALVEVIGLLATATSAAWRFGAVDKVAGRLMIPYVGWIAYAAALNGALWRLNPQSRLIKNPGGGGGPRRPSERAVEGVCTGWTRVEEGAGSRIVLFRTT